MTVKLANTPKKRRSRGSTPREGLASIVRRKRVDESVLRGIAEQLDGRPVPGLRMTESEYEAWCDDRVNSEWVDGEVILMPPVGLEQSDYFGWVYRTVVHFVEHHDLGKVLGPEFTIRLASERSRRVPDVLVVLKHRLHLLRPTLLNGAPDIAFEIVAPSSVSRDWRDKYEEYQGAGVREYWIIDPGAKKMETYSLRGRKYRRIEEDEDERVASTVLKGFFIRTGWLWKATLPRVSTVLRELGVSGR